MQIPYIVWEKVIVKTEQAVRLVEPAIIYSVGDDRYHNFNVYEIDKNSSIILDKGQHIFVSDVLFKNIQVNRLIFAGKILEKQRIVPCTIHCYFSTLDVDKQDQEKLLSK